MLIKTEGGKGEEREGRGVKRVEGREDRKYQYPKWKRHITTNLTNLVDIKRIISEYYEQMYAPKFDTLDEWDK